MSKHYKRRAFLNTSALPVEETCRLHPCWQGAILAVLLTLLLVACGSPMRAPGSSGIVPLAPDPIASTQPPLSCSTRLSPWSPAGRTWTMLVHFTFGSRSGQTERSTITFLPSGTLTESVQGGPPALRPARDGRWCATGHTTFAYVFKEPLVAGDQMVAYVQIALTARMTGATTYIGDGVGIAYAATTDLPMAEQYNVAQTTAVALPG